jgi:hypothetical protein
METILVATDFSDSANNAVDYAIELAKYVEEPNEEFSSEKTKTAAVIEKKLEVVPHKSVFITQKNVGKALEDYFNEHPTDIVIVNPKSIIYFIIYLAIVFQKN